MDSAMLGSFAFTVVLMVTTAYFLAGGLPLLVLRPEVPLDGRFVRRFFVMYYRVAFWTALGAAACYALWDRYGFAVGALAVAAVVVAMRRVMTPVMSDLGTPTEAAAAGAVERFKRLHSAALLVNLLQLVLLVWGLVRLSWQIV